MTHATVTVVMITVVPAMYGHGRFCHGPGSTASEHAQLAGLPVTRLGTVFSDSDGDHARPGLAAARRRASESLAVHDTSLVPARAARGGHSPAGMTHWHDVRLGHRDAPTRSPTL